jgi:hypothetical protein
MSLLKRVDHDSRTITVNRKRCDNAIYRDSPNISSYFVAKQQRSLWIQGLRKKMIQAHNVFILNNNFENSHLTWPKKLEESGAIRVHEIDDILQGLARGIDQITED